MATHTLAFTVSLNVEITVELPDDETEARAAYDETSAAHSEALYNSISIASNIENASLTVNDVEQTDCPPGED